MFWIAIILLIGCTYLTFWTTHLEPVPFPGLTHFCHLLKSAGINRRQFVYWATEEKLRKRSNEEFENFMALQQENVLHPSHPV